MSTPRATMLLRRLAATGYDLLVLGGVLMASSFALVIARGGQPVPTGNLAYQAFIAAQAAAFFIGFWSHGGQTPGMRAWRLRVETTGGNALPVQTATWRFAAALVSVASAGIGLAWLLFDPAGRAWHDRWTATRIVTLPPVRA